MSENAMPPWAGFWRRVGAYVLDAIIVGAPLAAVGFAAFDTFAAMGVAGRLVGLAAGLAYFGFLESALGRGRTLGKRLLGIRVTTLNGDLTMGRATVRALIKIAPFILNGIHFADATPVAVVLLVPAGLAIFALPPAQLYLLIFNRPSRRAVHDLLCGSYVVRAGASAEPVTSGRHPIIAGAIAGMIVAALAGTLAFVGFRFPRTLAELKPVQEAVLASPDVLDAGVVRTQNTFWGTSGKTTTRSVTVTVRLRRWPSDPQAEMTRIARDVRPKLSFAPGETLGVQLQYGFELGFASGSKTERGWRLPEEW